MSICVKEEFVQVMDYVFHPTSHPLVNVMEHIQVCNVKFLHQLQIQQFHQLMHLARSIQDVSPHKLQSSIC